MRPPFSKERQASQSSAVRPASTYLIAPIIRPSYESLLLIRFFYLRALHQIPSPDLERDHYRPNSTGQLTL